MGICQSNSDRSTSKHVATPITQSVAASRSTPNPMHGILTTSTREGDAHKNSRHSSSASEKAHAYWKKDEAAQHRSNANSRAHQPRQEYAHETPEYTNVPVNSRHPSMVTENPEPNGLQYDTVGFDNGHLTTPSQDVNYADPDENVHIQNPPGLTVPRQPYGFKNEVQAVNPSFRAAHDESVVYTNQESITSHRKTSRSDPDYQNVDRSSFHEQNSNTNTNTNNNSTRIRNQDDFTVQHIPREETTAMLGESQFQIGDFVIRAGRSGNVISAKMESQKVVHFAMEDLGGQIRFKPHDAGVTNPFFRSFEEMIEYYRHHRLRKKDNVFLQNHVFKGSEVTYSTAPYKSAKATSTKEHPYMNSAMEHNYMNTSRTSANAKVFGGRVGLTFKNSNDDDDDDKHDYENDDFEVSA